MTTSILKSVLSNSITVSTVLIDNKFETVVLTPDFEDLEIIISSDLSSAAANHNAMVGKYSDNLIIAGDLEIGDQIAESDGFLLTVIEVVKETAKTISVKLYSDFSSMKSFQEGKIITFRKSTKVYAVKAA